MTFEQAAGFLETWNRGRDRKERVYISYDATNKNCQAGDVRVAEYGHAKDAPRGVHIQLRRGLRPG